MVAPIAPAPRMTYRTREVCHGYCSSHRDPGTTGDTRTWPPHGARPAGTTECPVAFGRVTSALLADGHAWLYGSFACAPTGLSPYWRSKLAMPPGGRATRCGMTAGMR